MELDDIASTQHLTPHKQPRLLKAAAPSAHSTKLGVVAEVERVRGFSMLRGAPQATKLVTGPDTDIAAGGGLAGVKGQWGGADAGGRRGWGGRRSIDGLHVGVGSG